MMYEIATFRRPSMTTNGAELSQTNVESGANTSLHSPTLTTGDETPTTPNVSVFEIDDEFNLPITVALFILISYIFIGAVIYCMWEEWNFFASFYFVFISMSTIGFGDIVPQKPLCMFVTIVYLVFGLALMSMCINVVQEKLSDTFKHASAKLSATIGFEAEDDGSLSQADTIELPGVHTASLKTSGNTLLVPGQTTSDQPPAPRNSPDSSMKSPSPGRQKSPSPSAASKPPPSPGSLKPPTPPSPQKPPTSSKSMNIENERKKKT